MYGSRSLLESDARAPCLGLASPVKLRLRGQSAAELKVASRCHYGLGHACHSLTACSLACYGCQRSSPGHSPSFRRLRLWHHCTLRQRCAGARLIRLSRVLSLSELVNHFYCLLDAWCLFRCSIRRIRPLILPSANPVF